MTKEDLDDEGDARRAIRKVTVLMEEWQMSK